MLGLKVIYTKHGNQENLKTQTNTQYPKHTQNLPIQHNLILSSGHKPNFDGWPCLTKYWPIFANFDYTFLTIRLSDCCHTSLSPISHNILPIQRLDFGFKSRALWTCVVVPTHQEILIGHVLLIQQFDWAQNSSKPIFYPTLSIHWSNFKSNYSIRWTHVVFAYNEISINKNI